MTPWTVASQFLCPWDFPGKNTRVGCHFLLLTQGLNPSLLHGQVDSLPLSHQGSVCIGYYVLFPWGSSFDFFLFYGILEYNSYKLNPMNCSLPGSSVHGIFQARVLEWVVISFSRQTTQPMKTIFSIPDLKTVKKTTNQIIIKTKTSFTSCHHFPPTQ